MKHVPITVVSTPDNTPKGLFVNAVGWDYSAILLSADFNSRASLARDLGEKHRRVVSIRLPTVKPFVVASVFAVELYIKSLLSMQATPVPKKHSLKGMFALVSDSARKRIEQLYDIEFAKEPALQESKAAHGGARDREYSMEYVIESCDQAFVEWRYYHEGTIASGNPNITPLKNGLRRYLVELHPTWDELIEEIHRK